MNLKEEERGKVFPASQRRSHPAQRHTHSTPDKALEGNGR